MRILRPVATCINLTAATSREAVRTEFLSDQVGTLLADEQGRRVCVGAQVVLAMASVSAYRTATQTALTGQMLRSTHLRFSVP